MRSKILPLLSSFVLAIPLASLAPTASAATSRYHEMSAASVCSTALPAGQSQVSMRPYGIYNAGPDSNYVSCNISVESLSDVATDGVAGTTGAWVWLGFTNSSASLSRKAICNVTGGNRWTGIGTGSSKSVTIAASDKGSLEWDDLDRVDQWGSLNVSCILAPGVELNLIIAAERDKDDAL